MNDTASPDVSARESVDPDQIESYRDAFGARTADRIARNAVTHNQIREVALNRDAVIEGRMTFSHEIESGPITSQKRSGRCWLFAALNWFRLDCMEAMDLEGFELSPSYLMFWDKLEKANYFLESILETTDESTRSRLVSWLLDDPVDDAGQWDMFINLVDKYGVVPKEVYPESESSSSTRVMNTYLTEKLREWAGELRRMSAEDATLPEMRARKEEMLETVYRILAIHNGEPPESFEWSWRDEEGEFHDAGELTPTAFFERYVDVELDDYVSLIHCPTPNKPMGATYTVDHLGNVAGGRPIRYLNADIDVLRSAARAYLEDEHPVWFGCDVGKQLHRDRGILDDETFDIDALYGTDFQMSKSDRVAYGHSKMTHAMLFTGMHLQDDEVVRWKVENSWGDDNELDGFLVMDDGWFDDYLFQVVIPHDRLPDELREALDEEPIHLSPWDPMGALARCR